MIYPSEYSNVNQSDNNEIFLFSLNNHISTREELDINPNSQDKLSIDVKQMESIFNEDSTEQYAIKKEITPEKEEIRRQQRADIELLHKISYLKEKIIPDSKKEAARLLVDINQYLLDEHDLLKSNEEPRNTEIYENQNSI